MFSVIQAVYSTYDSFKGQCLYILPPFDQHYRPMIPPTEGG